MGANISHDAALHGFMKAEKSFVGTSEGENIVWVTRWMPLRTKARSMGWGSTDTRLVIHDIVPPVALRAWRDPAPLAKAIGGINPIRAPRRKGTSRQDPKNIFAVYEGEYFNS